MLATAILPRRLCTRGRCGVCVSASAVTVALSVMCRTQNPVAWYSTEIKSRAVASDRSTRLRKKNKRKSGASPATRKKAVEAPFQADDYEAEVAETPPAAASAAAAAADAAAVPPPAVEQHDKKSTTALSPQSLWFPTGQDYEALVVYLLLYRRESLEPVVSTLRKERSLLDESVKRMEERIADLYLVREEIREMLQESAAVQRRTLSEVIREIGDSDEEGEKARAISCPAIATDIDGKEKEGDGEISL
ncbi:subtilisin-like serine peptidase [Trypanosoma grayi]|uniref:subtilisin-like serine peptidase n=1 Tax=Trypanosoma grayi TaxID=71804 RepID=UPI0004F4312F|nr:subtilisin-like serine peptidase [Trypanosoma grayi]KEG13426.1 subtilisin-like serine peptidase [Trypanosoma grayi]